MPPPGPAPFNSPSPTAFGRPATDYGFLMDEALTWDDFAKVAPSLRPGASASRRQRRRGDRVAVQAGGQDLCLGPVKGTAAAEAFDQYKAKGVHVGGRPASWPCNCSGAK
jgi:hypothetical protein